MIRPPDLHESNQMREWDKTWRLRKLVPELAVCVLEVFDAGFASGVFGVVRRRCGGGGSVSTFCGD